jgi:hypothetical protein
VAETIVDTLQIRYPAYKLQVKAKKQGVRPRSIMCPAAQGPWPSHSEGHRCGPMSHGSGHRLSAQEESGATMCPTAPDATSLLGRAPEPPSVPWLRIPPARSGGLSAVVCPAAA